MEKNCGKNVRTNKSLPAHFSVFFDIDIAVATIAVVVVVVIDVAEVVTNSNRAFHLKSFFFGCLQISSLRFVSGFFLQREKNHFFKTSKIFVENLIYWSAVIPAAAMTTMTATKIFEAASRAAPFLSSDIAARVPSAIRFNSSMLLHYRTLQPNNTSTPGPQLLL